MFSFLSSLGMLAPSLGLLVLGGSIAGIVAYLKLQRMSADLWKLKEDIEQLQDALSTKIEPAFQATSRGYRNAEASEPDQTHGGTASAGSRESSPDPTGSNTVVEELETGPVAVPAPTTADDMPRTSPWSDDAQDTAKAASAEQASPAASSAEDDHGHAAVSGNSFQKLLDELGQRWSVWVGGIALALGAVFLVRYSINAGFFGPTVRVLMAALLGILALGAGEWLRRVSPETRNERLRHAYIPGVLTAVGVIALLGAVYTSHALYGLIGPTLAFVLLGALSFGALGLGLLQGPAISGLGLAGSLVTPLLVASTEPSYIALYTYLAIIAAGALTLGRWRNWTWLSLATASGTLAWAGLGVVAHGGDAFASWLIYLATVFGLVIVICASKVPPFAKLEANVFHTVTLPLMVYAASAALLLLMLEYDNTSSRGLYACLGGMAAGLFIAWRWSALVLAAPGAALLWAIAFYFRERALRGSLQQNLDNLTATGGYWTHLFLLACIVSAVLMLVSTLAARRASATSELNASIWASTGAGAPLAVFIMLWMLTTKGEIEAAFSLAGFGLFAGTAFVVEWLYRQQVNRTDDRPRVLAEFLSPVSLFAGSSSAAAVFGLAAGLSGWQLTLGLTCAIAVTALAFTLRQVQALRVASASIAVLQVLHALYTVRTDHGAIGAAALFNELWLYFALPAGICWIAARLLSRTYTDRWSQTLEALAMSLAALFAVFQVRHYMNAGDLFALTVTLEELSLHILVGLSFSLGLSRVRVPGSERLFSIASRLPMLASLLMLVCGSLLALNPLVDASSPVRGGQVLNSLFLAYLLPGLFLTTAWWLRRTSVPTWLIKAMGAVSLALFFAYLTTSIRLAHRTGWEMALGEFPMGKMESYTYAFVWCLFALTIAALSRFASKDATRFGEATCAVLSSGSAVLVGIAAAALVLGNMYLANPAFVGEPEGLGSPFFNSLILAYFLPSLAMCGASLLLKTGHRGWERIVGNAAAAVALLALFAYITIAVRFAYQGSEAISVFEHPITDAEQYTYSIAWLFLGILLMAMGVTLKNWELRLGSAVVIVLTALKVFLVDMSALEGLLRAFSFVGLGAVLIAIGLVYQKLLARASGATNRAEA